VQKIIDLVGKNPQGVPNSNIIVVSDHGFSTFHTTVNLTNYLNTYLANQGFTQSQISAVQAYTSGPVAHIYINLAGREPGGTIDSNTYNSIQKAIVKGLNTFVDGNLKYGSGHQAVFDKIYVRPSPSGKGINSYIAQDSGDVFAILSDGYNFDGIQIPAVTRLGDTSSSFFSVPNFYGAHGYDSEIPKLSAIFYAAGPDISRRGSVGTIHNIDIAPTINSLLRVPSAKTVQGKAVRLTP
jgi:predicted AlkP superfamily pyrophosphatase or phosphodiesterase